MPLLFSSIKEVEGEQQALFSDERGKAPGKGEYVEFQPGQGTPYESQQMGHRTSVDPPAPT